LKKTIKKIGYGLEVEEWGEIQWAVHKLKASFG